MISVELLFLVFFALGFLALQCSSSRMCRGKKHSPKALAMNYDRFKLVDAEMQAGHAKRALEAWRAVNAIPTPLNTLRSVVQAFLLADKSRLVEEFTRHIRAHRSVMCAPRVAVGVLDVIARAGEVELMEEILLRFQEEAPTIMTAQVYDVLLGGYAAGKSRTKVQEVMKTMQNVGIKMSARGFSLTIKGFLKNNMAEAALQQTLGMKDAGYCVPSFAVVQLARAAVVGTGDIEGFLSAVELQVLAPIEAVAFLVDEYCLKQQRPELASRIERWARRSHLAFCSGVYNPILRLYAGTGDARGVKLFEDMRDAEYAFGEGFCCALLARCAEARFLRLAEQVARHLKKKKAMSVALYSAQMKVYAFCGMFGRACDLYDELLAEGLEPDSIMYGCLMRFAVDCGRTALAQRLFEKAPRLQIQNYMSLIRAAGRDGNIDRAFAILDKLQQSEVTLDLAAYNCVLDVCVSLGRIDRGRELIDSIRKVRQLDIVTWNTLLKGYCNKGDLAGAKSVVEEMERDGHCPNDISYNCLINAAVSSGHVNEAWDIVSKMERNGVKVDHYTVSIMMKSLKKMSSSTSVARALALLDSCKLDVYADEVLLNHVVDTCVRHKESRRLQTIIDGYVAATMQPSVHTYGTLIKACSVLKRIQRCRELWSEMVDVRMLQPNEITMGCMLDALVCNGRVQEAVELLNAWKERLPPNAVMYSTIIKGFANLRQPEKALELWQELRQAGGVMNTVVYNVVIDAHARVGSMDEVSKLVACMCKDGCLPDSITSSTIVKGYCVKGDMEQAMEVFHHMQTEGMVKDAIIYNTLLDGCVRHGRDDIAEVLLQEMQDHDVRPSVFTLGILVKLYGRQGKVDLAFEAVKTWPRRYGVSITPQVWTGLVGACLHDGDIDRAIQTLEDMKEVGFGINAKAYGAVIGSCLRAGNLSKALSLVEEALGLGSWKARGRPRDQVLEPETMEALLQAVSVRQGRAAATALVKRLVAANVPLSDKLAGLKL